ncbi:hypothetical protein N9112_00060 [bacterium]|nr:hypothetical protein [bacterium]
MPVSSDLLFISNAESVTNWNGDTFSLEPDIKTQGSNAVACSLTTNGANEVWFAGSWNLTGKTLRISMSIAFFGNLQTTTPIDVFLYDNAAEYINYFASIDDYSGGWVDIIIDCDQFTATTLTAVTRVGIRFTTASKPRNVPANAWFDNWRYANTLTITSTTTEAVSFSDAAAADATAEYFMLIDDDGTVKAFADIIVGGSGSENCNLVSINEQINFPERNVADTLYNIRTQQGTGNTDVDVQGSSFKNVGTAVSKVIFNQTVNSFSSVGGIYNGLSELDVSPVTTSPVFEGNTLVGIATPTMGIDAVGGTVDSCGEVTISASGSYTGAVAKAADVLTTEGAFSAANLNQVDKCDFTAGAQGNAVRVEGAINIPSASDVSMNWDNTASGYGADGAANAVIRVALNRTSTGKFVVIVADTATVPTVIDTNGGTLNVDYEIQVGQKTLTLSQINDGAEVRLRKGSYTLSHTQNVTGGSAQYSYTYNGDEEITISVGGAGFVRREFKYTLKNADADIPVPLDPNPSYI